MAVEGGGSGRSGISVERKVDSGVEMSVETSRAARCARQGKCSFAGQVKADNNFSRGGSALVTQEYELNFET